MFFFVLTSVLEIRLSMILTGSIGSRSNKCLCLEYALYSLFSNTEKNFSPKVIAMTPLLVVCQLVQIYDCVKISRFDPMRYLVLTKIKISLKIVKLSCAYLLKVGKWDFLSNGHFWRASLWFIGWMADACLGWVSMFGDGEALLTSLWVPWKMHSSRVGPEVDCQMNLLRKNSDIGWVSPKMPEALLISFETYQVSFKL